MSVNEREEPAPLPCPFCGVKPELCGSGGYACFNVDCALDGIVLRPEAWNRRVSKSRSPAPAPEGFPYPVSHIASSDREDVERMVRVMGWLTPEQAAGAWEGYSRHMMASWLILPDSDDDLRAALEGYTAGFADGFQKSGRSPAEVPPTAEVTKLLRTLGSYVASANETAQRHLPIGTQELAREAMVMANALESQAAVWRSAQQ